MGPTVVGTNGYEGPIDYAAIGNVVNLASRLCGTANDTQILLDPVVAAQVKHGIALESLGVRPIKGYDRPLQIVAAAHRDLRLPRETVHSTDAGVAELEAGDQLQDSESVCS